MSDAITLQERDAALAWLDDSTVTPSVETMKKLLRRALASIPKPVEPGVQANLLDATARNLAEQIKVLERDLAMAHRDRDLYREERNNTRAALDAANAKAEGLRTALSGAVSTLQGVNPSIYGDTNPTIAKWRALLRAPKPEGRTCETTRLNCPMCAYWGGSKPEECAACVASRFVRKPAASDGKGEDR